MALAKLSSRYKESVGVLELVLLNSNSVRLLFIVTKKSYASFLFPLFLLVVAFCASFSG